MFTGIIEELGRIDRIARRQGTLTLRVSRPRGREGLSIGESIAVDGVCLTVTAHGPGWFESELSQETCRRSTFAAAREGAAVNLERPLAASGRFGGHIVQGHVDATGAVASVKRLAGFVEMRFAHPPSMKGFLVEKGSVAVNGVSLTVSGLRRGTFAAALIPHTLEATNLGGLKSGDPVNLEADVLAKYVRAALGR